MDNIQLLIDIKSERRMLKRQLKNPLFRLFFGKQIRAEINALEHKIDILERNVYFDHLPVSFLREVEALKKICSIS